MGGDISPVAMVGGVLGDVLFEISHGGRLRRKTAN
jgi:hypothetical protein